VFDQPASDQIEAKAGGRKVRLEPSRTPHGDSDQNEASERGVSPQYGFRPATVPTLIQEIDPVPKPQARQRDR
jgi:hypothetical protein